MGGLHFGRFFETHLPRVLRAKFSPGTVITAEMSDEIFGRIKCWILLLFWPISTLTSQKTKMQEFHFLLLPKISLIFCRNGGER
jgi:hypothetical protein